jgi:hypothetical protein
MPATSSTSRFIEFHRAIFSRHQINHPNMKTKMFTLAALALLPAALFAEGPTQLAKILVTGSLQDPATQAQQLDKFLVTGSLQDPVAAEPQKLEKFMVTGSLQDAATEPQQLDKFMVTGSLEDPADAPAKMEKFMVTGSREDLPAVKLRHKR